MNEHTIAYRGTSIYESDISRMQAVPPDGSEPIDPPNFVVEIGGKPQETVALTSEADAKKYVDLMIGHGVWKEPR